MIFSSFTQKLKEKAGGLLEGGVQRVCCWPPHAPPPSPRLIGIDLLYFDIFITASKVFSQKEVQNVYFTSLQ